VTDFPGGQTNVSCIRETTVRIGLEDDFLLYIIPIICERLRALQSDIVAGGVCEEIPTLFGILVTGHPSISK